MRGPVVKGGYDGGGGYWPVPAVINSGEYQKRWRVCVKWIFQVQSLVSQSTV